MAIGLGEQGGYKVIIEAVEKLGEKHAEHIAAYGEGNERRLTGRHETASISDFSYGVANRGASIRIGRQTHAEQKGYMEDRRPASNMDPYVVTGMIVQVRRGVTAEVKIRAFAGRNRGRRFRHKPSELLQSTLWLKWSC